MNIHVVYHSRTGHTKAVIEKVVALLIDEGHLVTTHPLQANLPPKMLAGLDKITSGMDTSGSEVLIIGTPVHGGMMAAPVRTFLEGLQSLEGIYFALLITHFFRRGWGAVQTIQEMRSICEAKGGIFLAQMDVKWLSLFRKKEIKESIRIFIEDLLSEC
jgi:flavodoxin